MDLSKLDLSKLSAAEQDELRRLLEEEHQSTLVILHSVPRPVDQPERETTPEGQHVLRVPLVPESGRMFMGIPRPRHQRI